MGVKGMLAARKDQKKKKKKDEREEGALSTAFEPKVRAFLGERVFSIPRDEVFFPVARDHEASAASILGGWW